MNFYNCRDFNTYVVQFRIREIYMVTHDILTSGRCALPKKGAACCILRIQIHHLLLFCLSLSNCTNQNPCNVLGLLFDQSAQNFLHELTHELVAVQPFTEHILDLDLNDQTMVATSDDGFIKKKNQWCTNRAYPIQPISRFLKNCQNGAF